MMLNVLIIFVTILGVLIYTIANKNHANALLPPGPRGLPFVGNLLQFAGITPHLKLSQWALQYGKLYTIKFGSKPVLVITDVKMMRELLGLKVTTSNPITEITALIPHGRWGLLAKGQTGLEQRQFLTRVIRKFGFGGASCKETLIKQEVRKVITWIKTEQDKSASVCLKEKLKQASSNALWTICSGEQFQADPELNIVVIGVNFMKHLHNVIKNGLVFCPWIRYLAPEASGFNQYIASLNNLHKYVTKILKHRILTREKGKEPQNIIDAYIDKVESCEDSGSSFYGESGWKHCVSCIVSLFIAGGDGSGMMVNWIIFYLCVHPKVQRKVQQEIEKVIGSEREASLEDKRIMPYTEAVILEALRFASLVATGFTHSLTENITFHGYKLPKGMLIQPLLYHVHFDKDIWKDPENFRPERFLGDGMKMKEHMVPFQVGKRMCPGQEIAYDNLFLNVAMLLQKYSFEVDHSETANVQKYLEPEVTLFLEPKSLPVLAIERK